MVSLHFAAIDIYDIGYNLESIETDAKRQCQLQQLQLRTAVA